MIGIDSMSLGVRYVRFDPNVPYTYIPDADFSMLDALLK
jgi:hypothetical protein